LSSDTHQHKECRALLQRLSDYLDGDLGEGLCEKIRVHARACPPCEAVLRSLRKTVKLCQHTSPTKLTAAQKSALRETIMSLAAAPRLR
jgi:hypothetical protein